MPRRRSLSICICIYMYCILVCVCVSECIYIEQKAFSLPLNRREPAVPSEGAWVHAIQYIPTNAQKAFLSEAP